MINNNNVSVENNSVVVITDIGDINVPDSHGLVCGTQLTPCCLAFGTRHGQWYYPNGTQVSIDGAGYYFYRIRRDASPGVLGGALLNRRFGAVSPTGIYSCVIPGADGVDQNLFVGLYLTASNSKC